MLQHSVIALTKSQQMERRRHDFTGTATTVTELPAARSVASTPICVHVVEKCLSASWLPTILQSWGS